MCYTIPLVATLILNGIKKAKKTESPHLERLNLLFLGGTMMLVVDHLWNKEIFLIGENIVGDLLLGAVMTGAILVFWGIMVWSQRRQAMPACRQALSQ